MGSVLFRQKCKGRIARGSFTPTPSQVGSRTGAPTVGSGGSSKAFALGLSPAPLVTFPAPATSNPAYGFPVPGFPGCFAPRVMRPIRLRALSAWAGNNQAVTYSTSFRRSPSVFGTVRKTPGRFSLRLGVYPPAQFRQTDGRFYHGVPASLFERGTASQQGSFAPRALPQFIATTNPSATLSSSANFPGPPVIWPTLLRQFLGGTRRASPVAQHVLVTVLSLSPRRSEMPLQPACGASCCLRPMIGGSASGAMNFRGHLCVHSRYGPVTRSPSH